MANMSTTEMLNQVDLSYKVIDYWIEHHIIRPAVTGFGSGHRHKWSPENLLTLKVLSRVHKVFAGPATLIAVREALDARKPTDEVVIIFQGYADTASFQDVVNNLSPNRVTTLVRIDDL